MNSTSNRELQAFQSFITEKISSGQYLSPEDVLDQWRDLHPEPEEEFETEAEAIQAALDDVANGDKGIPLEEFDREFRKKYNLPDHK